MNPIGTSTPMPGVKKVGGRRSIHDKDFPSPVLTDKPKNDKNTKENGNLKMNLNHVEGKINDKREQTNENKDDLNKQEGLIEELNQVRIEFRSCKSNTLNYIKRCVVNKQFLINFLYVSIIIIALLFPITPSKLQVKKDSVSSINILKLHFPNQTNDFWHYITSNIKETEKFNKPSIILFLYLEEHESKSHDLILRISRLASKALSDNGNIDVEPIVVDGTKLNTAQYLKDYGVLIDDYKHVLENRHVMVVKNVEKVKSKVSQAFHVICDEYTPLVEKVFVMFSIQVRKFDNNEVKQAGEILRETWNDLNGDKLEPLIARVTNVVLKINPEL